MSDPLGNVCGKVGALPGLWFLEPHTSAWAQRQLVMALRPARRQASMLRFLVEEAMEFGPGGLGG